ncbi:gamma-glutamyltransferase [bacterium AH-315-K03]|nr:gamma-glutamyltransferase [bacterium AH-315-K03]
MTVVRRSLLFLLLCSSLGVWASDYARTSNNGVGAVASVHPLATQAGLDVLEKGGTAIDAAVATALTLGVVDSQNSGIGGGCFAVIHFADGRVLALDGREMAPKAAHRDMYLVDGKGDISLSTTGALAIGVPGSLAVYQHLLKEGGKFSLKDLLLPAAQLAEDGFALSQVSHSRLKATAKKLRLFPSSAKILLNEKGQPWPAGHQLIQKDLATTYRGIANEGIDYFYRGGFTKALDQWMKKNNGLVVFDDFANYKMLIREPIKSHYRGYDIYGFPPPSSGGVHVAQMLNILQNFSLATLSEEDRYHVVVEAMKLAFADRAYFLGDPDFVPVPKGLISPEYANALAKKISLKKTAKQVHHGKPPGADIDLFGKHTTHISAADKFGNWVAITTTVNTSFGSKVIIPGTGVVMNNQMDDFSIQPGVPNAFGLVGSEANSVQAGKRPLSSMSPTIIVKDGKPIITIGAAGGPTIISQVLQGIINIIDLDMGVDDALAASRVHHQWQPDVTFVERGLNKTVEMSLRERGHKLHARGHMGVSQVIKAEGKSEFGAAADPRVIERNKSIY